MKKILAIIGVAFLLTITSQAASGVNNTNNQVQNLMPTNQVYSIPSFLSQAEVWGTTFNTNYLIASNKLEVTDGYRQQTGQGASDVVNIQYNFTSRWHGYAEGDFFGLGSKFTELDLGCGFGLVDKYDFRFDVNLAGGYNAASESWCAIPQLKVSKMTTINTLLSAAVGTPAYSKGKFNSTPTFWLYAGFTF